MSSRKSGIVLASGLVVGLLAVCAAADPNSDHARMKVEHHKVHDEHDALLKKLARWGIEHRKAIAALRDIEASILEHDAVLAELAEHAREHEDHIRHHEEEIADHEGGGDGKHHADLERKHKALLDEHAAVMKRMKAYHDDHEELMAGLKKLRDGLKQKQKQKQE